MRVVEACRGLRFTTETRRVGCRRQGPPQHHLQGHDTVQAPLPSAVDHTHSTASDFFKDFVVFESGCHDRIFWLC